MTAKIYHNPRCSKSRQALQLLRDRGFEVEIVDYLKTPPDGAAVRHLLQMLALAPRDLMRKQEKEYKELGLHDPDLDAEVLIDALVEHPRLLERPIVVKDGAAVIGRPPEDVLKLF